MKRACDFLVDRFVARELDLRVRNALRLGAYQLHFLQMPPHAAVGETVEVAPKAGARPGERRPPPGRRRRGRVARRRHAPQLPGLDRRPAASPTSARATPSTALERMNTRAAGHRARRRLRAGPGQPVGGRGRRARSRASGWPTCARRPGGKAMVLAATGAHGRRRRHPQGPRRAHPRRTPPACPVRRRRRRPTRRSARLVRPGPGRRTVLRPRAPCAAVPTPGGGSTRPPRSAWRRCSARSSTRPSRSCSPGGTLVYSVCTLTDAEGPGDRRAPRAADTRARGRSTRPDGPWEPPGPRRTACCPHVSRHRRHVPPAASRSGLTAGIRGAAVREGVPWARTEGRTP